MNIIKKYLVGYLQKITFSVTKFLLIIIIFFFLFKLALDDNKGNLKCTIVGN